VLVGVKRKLILLETLVVLREILGNISVSFFVLRSIVYTFTNLKICMRLRLRVCLQRHGGVTRDNRTRVRGGDRHVLRIMNASRRVKC
jgi:hypothetical protein